MNDIRQPARHRGRGPGRLIALALALFVMLGLSGGTAFAAPDDAEKPSHAVWVPASAKDVVAAMQPSWNLGNTLDAIPDEGSWGNGQTTKATFEKVAADGSAVSASR